MEEIIQDESKRERLTHYLSEMSRATNKSIGEVKKFSMFREYLKYLKESPKDL